MQGEQLEYFMNRWRGMIKAKMTRLYAEWLTVIDPRTDDSCAALHGKLYKVDGDLLQY